PRIGIITVGDELLSGRVADTSSAWLAGRLAPFGYRISCHISVGDSPGELSSALRRTGEGADALIICGGLGPTEDDRTREEIASALGVPLEFREESWRRIVGILQGRGVHSPPPRNRRQARFPAGAEEISNPRGSAPAFRVRGGGGGWWWALPGVPHELHAIFEVEVLPELQRSLPPPLRSDRGEVLHFHRVPEAALDEWLVGMLAEGGAVPPTAADGPCVDPADALRRYHIRVEDGEIEVRLPPGLELAALARERYGDRFLGAGPAPLAQRLVEEARAAAASLATAESCTGGLLSARLTASPGASEVYRGGWVAYSEEAKIRELGVEREILERFGAVSSQTAIALARGARARAEVSIAVAITGIAGPGGGTAEKPVGTTYLGLATAEGACWRLFRHRGERASIRSLSANEGLFALLVAVRGRRPEGWNRS
ncbi:MAG: CinA family nicotinamide mononucleotide deamidase-related protein, partial [Planctomycetota bacterium]